LFFYDILEISFQFVKGIPG